MSEVLLIPPSSGVLQAAAVFLKEELKIEPPKLPQVSVLLPTRRAKRAFQEILYGVYGESSLPFPKLLTFEDAFADPCFQSPEFEKMSRVESQAALARLLMQEGKGKDFPEALSLAEEILNVEEEMAARKIPFERLDHLGAERLSLHRQDSLTFLKGILKKWRIFCEDRGTYSSSFISFDEAGWLNALGNKIILTINADEQDPKIEALLKRLENREQTYFFKTDLQEGGVDGTARDRLCRVLFQKSQGAATENLFQGIEFYETSNESKEVSLVALLMREAYEKGRKTALVTGDRSFAYRIKEALKQWDLCPDDASGTPLSLLPAGSVVTLLFHLLDAPKDSVARLSFLKHPLVRFGRTYQEFYGALEDLELFHRTRCSPSEEALSLKDVLQTSLNGFLGKKNLRQTLSHWVKEIKGVLSEALKNATLRREERESLSALFEELSSQGRFYPPLSYSEAKQLVLKALSGTVVRQVWETSPNLFIWEPWQALDQPVEFMILSHFHEGEWPRVSKTDIFMSPAMRKALGLSSEASDLARQEKALQRLMTAPYLTLTASQRRQGTPVELSRWGHRLKAIAAAAGVPLPARKEVLHWLDLKNEVRTPKYLPRPHPKPPLTKRPDSISATAVERLLENPYLYYVQHILNLRELPPLTLRLDPLLYGTAAHKVLELLAPSACLSEDFEGAFQRAFRDFSDDPFVTTFWYARLKGAVRDLETRHLLMSPLKAGIFAEIKGEIRIENHRLIAKADRIEITPERRIRLIDFKTGALPSKKKAIDGLALQLPLEALILSRGGFEGIYGKKLEALMYIRLIGGEKGVDTLVLDEDLSALSERAERLLKSTLRHFSCSENAYFARASWDMRSTPGTASHLMRGQEWLNNLS